jgi:hypothetical protein
MTKQTNNVLTFCYISLLIFLTINGACHRTASDFIEYSTQIAFIQGIIVYQRIFMWWRYAARPKFSFKLLLLMVVAIPVGLILISIWYYALWAGLKESYFQIEGLIPSTIFSIGFTVIAVLSLGYLLFLFRMAARFFYGLTEAVFGVIVAISRIPNPITDPSSWESGTYLAMLTAGVYLLVRGFDNMHAGLKPESYDRILKYTEDSIENMWKVRQSTLREPVDVDDEVES